MQNYKFVQDEENVKGMTNDIHKRFSIILPILLNSYFKVKSEGEWNEC